MKLSEMGAMARITEQPERSESSDSATSESLSDKEHELDRDMP